MISTGCLDKLMQSLNLHYKLRQGFWEPEFSEGFFLPLPKTFSGKKLVEGLFLLFWRRFIFLLVFSSAVFVLSYDVWFFILQEAKGATWREVLLRDGIIIDGAGKEPFHGDLLIRGSRIIAMGRDLSPGPGTRVIDLQGSFVLPGFIELHPGLLPTGAEQEKWIRAGVTTIIGGDAGFSPIELKDYLESVSRQPPCFNYGMLFGLGSLRAVLEEETKPTRECDLEKAGEFAKNALAGGALGFSLDLDSFPGGLWEWGDVQKLVSGINGEENGRILLVIDFPEEIVFREDAFQQTICQVLEKASGSSLALHLRNFRLRRSAPPTLIAALRTCFQEARARGVWVSGDLNPFGFTGGPCYPLTAAAERFSAEDLIFAKVPKDLQEIVGKSLAEVARSRRVCVSTLVSQLRDRNIYVEVVETGAEQEFSKLSFFCWQAVYPGGEKGADPDEEPRPYFSIFGNQPVLGIAELEKKVQKLTALPAKIFGLEQRGAIKPGYYADLLVVRPRANGSNYYLEHVLVNGRFVLKNGQFTGAAAGQLLKRS